MTKSNQIQRAEAIALPLHHPYTANLQYLDARPTQQDYSKSRKSRDDSRDRATQDDPVDLGATNTVVHVHDDCTSTSLRYHPLILWANQSIPSY